MSVHISAHMDDWFESLDAIFGPGMETVAALDAVLEVAFAETQSLTHVITGSLKGSGRTSSDTTEDEWKGEISYGGPSPGFPNDPVNYAKYEFGRGGSHDALRNVDLVHHDFIEAMYTSMNARMRA